MTSTILTSAAAGEAIGAKLGSAVGIAAFGTAIAGTLPFAVLGAAAAGGAAYIGGALIGTAGAGAAAGGTGIGAGVAKFAAGASAAQAAGALYRAAKRRDARTGRAAVEAVVRSLDAEQDHLDAAAARRPLFVEPLDLHAVSADDWRRRRSPNSGPSAGIRPDGIAAVTPRRVRTPPRCATRC